MLLTVSCSTRKNTFATRTYHTITSKWNVNFNGKEALLKGIADLDKKKKDNYLEILPIYYYAPKQDLTSVFPSLDRTIEKASKSVFKHSILIRGKEYVKTMNEAYLMMGKAYFYKQDYNQAKRIFNYIIATYNDWGSVEEATIWLARCEMKQDYFVRAQSLLEEINPRMLQNTVKTTSTKDNDEVKKSKPASKSKSKYNKYQKKNQKKKLQAQAKKEKESKKKTKIRKRKITNNVRLQYYAAEAEYNLLAPNGDIETAIDNIKLALDNKPKKDFRIRLYFILGQLYEKLDNRQEAQKWFLKVIKATPEYEMEFSSRMHLAVNYDGTQLSKRTITKELNKMLKDSKNEDYRDQIYFAFAEIARIDDNDADREFYLAKSVAAYTINDYQRTYSAVSLADIYFFEEEYIKAQAYYDTALLSLPQNYPNKENIIKKASILSDLVENLQIIQLQDSLQRIANLSEGQRQAWVNKMIANYTEEERRLAKEEADRMLALQATQNFANVNVNTQGQSNKWYFYNPGLVSQGATEFYRRFGNRKLEDNWRISNKTAISFEEMADMNAGVETQEEDEFDDEGNLIAKREIDPKKPAYYTQDLPLTPESLEASNTLIMNAMYNAGIIYFDQLNDLKRSNEMLEKLIKRFSQSELVLPSYFLLWSNYTKLNNKQKADEAKNFILTNYPDSDYAKLILDPNYYKKLADKAKENENRYEELYGVYQLRQWERTVQIADELIENSNNVDLIAKTSYLRAVALGQIEGQETLKDALTQIIKDFPKEEVAELAKILLSTFSDSNQFFSSGDNNDMGILSENDKAIDSQNSPFNPNLDELHYIIILVDVHKKVVNDVKYDVSNFNSTYFSLERFNINSLYLSQDEQQITVARFKGKTDAMNYYIAFTTNDLFSPSIVDNSIFVYAISASNYSIYYHKVEQRYLYKKFFEENYLK
jgi:tetratricopeptide (TPR) repeat protein